MGRGTRSEASAQAQRRRPLRESKWTLDRIQEELEEYLGERTDMPGLRELRDSGRGDLAGAIENAGGTKAWAAMLGLTLSDRQVAAYTSPPRKPADRSPYGQDRALTDAQQVIGELGELPGIRRLHALGYTRLAAYVRRCGGNRAFCRQVGIPVELARRPSTRGPSRPKHPPADASEPRD